MTDHGKIEHALPNGDLLILDATRKDPKVDKAFRKVEEDFARKAQQAYRELRKSAAA